MNYRFTVHFSTSFSTTRPFSDENGTLLSGRHSDSRLRHLLRDFGEGRFGRLFLGFLFAHSPPDVTNPGRLNANVDHAKLLPCATVAIPAAEELLVRGYQSTVSMRLRAWLPSGKLTLLSGLSTASRTMNR